MAKKKSAPAAKPAIKPHAPAIDWSRYVWPGLALLVVLFYWTPLFDDQASIQWDMADVHYSAQKYFEQSLRTTGLPRWTPFEFSGMPFLADPQTAAWYPLHWPFFLAGITPRAMEWELALHAFLALGGMFLFARKLIGNFSGAVLAAIVYAFGGFFAGHSSHLGMFETAALFPWMMWAAMKALESGAARDLAITGLIAGLLVLAGHFQTALYAFFALALAMAVLRGPVLRRALVLATAVVGGFLISAIQTLPAVELAGESGRASMSYHGATNAALNPGALATLVMPNFYGVLSGEYKGPGDITQFYFYGGLLLVPLAIAAFVRRRNVALPAVLIFIPLWYALGPKTGLYDLLTLLPGFGSVRAPVHIWFVIAFGLAVAAGVGLEIVRNRWLAIALIVFSAGDVWLGNMSANPLAYARASWAERYGNNFDRYQAMLAPAKTRPLYRIWAPFTSNSFGPLDSALEARTEVTYGYNPLELARYGEYTAASNQNPKLLNGLAVTHKLDASKGALVENPEALPRISAPGEVKFARDAASARRMLDSLDPAQTAIVEGSGQDFATPGARVEILNYADDYYRVRYSAAGECLLRIAVPYFPGWTAAIDGQPAEVRAVDYALSGVIAPAGEHELTLRYRSRRLAAGAFLSAAGALICLGILLYSAFGRRIR